MFKDKTIGIIGCGGLGGYVIEEVIRLNPKKIILFDGDKFSLSNLNRQLYSSLDNIGSYKVDETLKRINSISSVNVSSYKEFLNEDNINILKECDLVFDCVDNIKTRLLLSSYCVKNSIPLVHGAVSSIYGEVCLLTNRDLLKVIYKDKEEEKEATNSFGVGAIASIEVAVASKYFMNNYDDIIDKLIMIDLNDLSITKLKI